jgi:hypothetical protein
MQAAESRRLHRPLRRFATGKSPPAMPRRATLKARRGSLADSGEKA